MSDIERKAAVALPTKKEELEKELIGVRNDLEKVKNNDTKKFCECRIKLIETALKNDVDVKYLRGSHIMSTRNWRNYSSVESGNVLVRNARRSTGI